MILDPALCGFGFPGKPVSDPLLFCFTEGSPGTFRASGFTGWETDGGAQFHQRLGKGGGAVWRDHRQSSAAYPVFYRLFHNIGIVGADPHDHAEDVSVHSGSGDPIGNGADGAGGVTADPFQGEELSVIRGQFPVISFHDLPGGSLQVAYPVVIAETLPELQQAVFRAVGKILYGGKSSHKTLKIGLYGFYPGLLQHDFGNPDTVRRDLFPPGKDPRVPGVPGQQRFCNF